MKLNENGDFCLLYVEPVDEKQSLFKTIGEQQKPVVLMLPLAAGKPRSRLFQRPEDFSDLKHVRRQSGVSIIFLTSGSEFLAQMAARYGFPAYPSVDGFAEFLVHGHRGEHEESAPKGYPHTARRVRTGPLVPSSAQIAALRRSIPTRPLSARAGNEQWSGSEEDALPVYSAAFHQATTLPPRASADLAWFEDGLLPSEPSTPPTLASMRPTPPPPGRANGYVPTNALAYEMSSPDSVEPRRASEIPRRRSAQVPDEPHTRHPGRGSEEYMFEQGRRQPVPTQEPRGLAGRPVLEARDHQQARRPDYALPTAPVQRPPTPPSQPEGRRRRNSFWPLLVILTLLIVAGGALGSFVAIAHVMPTSGVAHPVGTVTFVSSEQLNENTSQGIDDQIQVTLHNLGAPASGKSYYAWLLGDKEQLESQSILLGKLNVVNGSLSLFYPGDTLHTNLLQITSRFLVTEEDSSVTPLLPSPDASTWRYYGALAAIPDPNDAHHFSFLNHLRHLLADEPILDEMELPGGLNNWFTRNTEKLIEWTSSARDRWQTNHDLTFVRGEAVQILSYLDGMSFLVQDLPPASANVQVALDTHLAALGLLNVRGSSQNPPSYMDQIVYHLNGLINAPGSPANARSTAARVLPAMSNVTTWLQKLRSDDTKLLAMSKAQLGQPAALSLLDDMALQASNAYSGSADPSTGQFRQGAVWIHQQLQSIATINISSYVTGTPVPSSQAGPTFLLPLLDAWRRLEVVL